MFRVGDIAAKGLYTRLSIQTIRLYNVVLEDGGRCEEATGREAGKVQAAWYSPSICHRLAVFEHLQYLLAHEAARGGGLLQPMACPHPNHTDMT